MSSSQCCRAPSKTSIRVFHNVFSSEMAYSSPHPAESDLILFMVDQISSLTAYKDFTPNLVSNIPGLHSSAFASVEGRGQVARFQSASSVNLVYHSGLRFGCQEGLLGIHNTLLNWKNHSCGRYHLVTVSWVVRDSYLDLNGVYL